MDRLMGLAVVSELRWRNKQYIAEMNHIRKHKQDRPFMAAEILSHRFRLRKMNQKILALIRNEGRAIKKEFRHFYKEEEK